MRYCGISDHYHDAAIAFIDEEGNIEFAAEAERYSKRKNEAWLHKYLTDMIRPDDHVTFYENTALRDSRADVHGLGPKVRPQARYTYRDYYLHHESHVYTAFYTRPWDSVEDTVTLSIDGYGEFQSAVIYDHNFNMRKEVVFPFSIGGTYASATLAYGLKPLEEEYIVMGASAYGEPTMVQEIENIWEKYCKEYESMIRGETTLLTERLRDSLVSAFHNLVRKDQYSFAASIQKWTENEILKLAKEARKYGSKLCYSGGVAQNIVANSLIKDLFDDMWIAVNPADGGSAIGAAARSWALDTGKNKLNWKDAYLGHNERSKVNPKEVAQYLHDRHYCGVINGRAEFGPRALGNRSLLGNPIYDVKDTVNKVKRRQRFRPFAPAIMEEFVDEYFEGYTNEYMQFTSMAKHDYKSVTHVDGTARVQIVRKDSSSILRPILEEFYELSGVPMLLNTSLNVRGKPICNDRYDAKLFEVSNNVRVFGS